MPAIIGTMGTANDAVQANALWQKDKDHFLHPWTHFDTFKREGSLVIREADKARPVVVTFAGQVAPPGPSTPDRERPGRIPTLVYVLGGVGVAALGVFVGLDVSGQSRYSACKSVACSSSTFDSIAVERDVTLTMGGLGVASLGAAAWFFFTRPAEPRSSSALHFDVDGRRGGGVLRAVGTF